MQGEATRQQTDVASPIGGVLVIVTCRLTSQSASARVTSVICEVMMKRFLAAALFLFPGIAQAEYFDTGDDLWNLCTDKFPGHNYLCIGLPAAYFDMLLATGYRCASTGIDRERVRDVVLKYLSDNPEKRNMPASELAITSLTTAFQCVRPAPAQTTSPTISTPRSSKPKGPLLLNPNR
jgi:Rap1a immunity proteins